MVDDCIILESIKNAFRQSVFSVIIFFVYGVYGCFMEFENQFNKKVNF